MEFGHNVERANEIQVLQDYHHTWYTYLLFLKPNCIFKYFSKFLLVFWKFYMMEFNHIYPVFKSSEIHILPYSPKFPLDWLIDFKPSENNLCFTYALTCMGIPWNDRHRKVHTVKKLNFPLSAIITGQYFIN